MSETHLLVGGVGFLGSNLASELLRRGLIVVILARKSSVARRRGLARLLEREGAKIVTVDRVESKHIEEVAADVIYHLAGKAGGPYKVQWEAHVGLLQEEMEAASAMGSKLVYISSIAVPVEASPQPPGSRLVEEDEHLWGRVARFETIHAETKAEGERRLVSSSLRWTILRPTLVAGRHAYHVEWRLVRLLARIGLVTSAPVQAVSARDVALVAADAGQGRFANTWINLASPYTLGDFAAATCRSMGRKRCVGVPVGWILRLGTLAPRTSPLRLAWSIARKAYRLESRILSGFEWRLEPSLDD